ncbi:MAG: radical SAM family heme chaperone HemW [Limnochordia bacterium]|jgi:oxygen-independent coproporphyrinogen-3 oxidase|nr:radical SAM family heme chaperone HemW [Limnochordia bacterium]
MGIYVHIPFCARKCNYCDFHSVVVSDEKLFSAVAGNYLLSLRQEALYYRGLWGERPLNTIFIGGGTPSLLPPQELASFILFLRERLPFVANPEISIEANPHSLTAQGARILAQAGVNRVSLGVQAFQDHLLEAIGRVHRTGEVKESVAALKQAGITNINLDLMFGLPGQSREDWLRTLERAQDLEPTHLSCYGLILEEGTALARWVSEGLVAVPGDDEQAEMYEIALGVLKESGYEHYEISNFCLPGFRSEHNLLYWRNEPFIGLGSGATGYVEAMRYRNAADVQGYMESWSKGMPFYEEVDEVLRQQEMDETMMVGMRLLQGVDEAWFYRRYEVSFWDLYREAIEDLLARGLVQHKEGCLRVTEQGLRLENQVSVAFLR